MTARRKVLTAEVPAGAQGSEITLSYTCEHVGLLCAVLTGPHKLTRVIVGNMLLWSHNVWGRSYVTTVGMPIQVGVRIERSNAHCVIVDLEFEERERAIGPAMCKEPVNG